jgi:ATP synthase protein I
MPESNSKLPPKTPSSAEQMIRRVQSRQARIARAQGDTKGIWSSIAILGVVGWSVAVPTLVGVAVGVWIDRRWPSRVSWTVTLLLAGLVLGCTNAWMRIKGDQS